MGVIGYITPDTKYLAPKNNVEFQNEIVVIKYDYHFYSRRA